MTDKQTDSNWRDIFVAYVNHVELSESFAFLDKRDWDPEDWYAILDALDRDVDETRF